MSKGLDALKRLVDGNLNEVNYYKLVTNGTTLILQDKEIIEQELKALELYEQSLNWLLEAIGKNEIGEAIGEINYLKKQREALEIIKNKHIPKYAIDTFEEDWNLIEVKGKDLTQEEYDLLKEVLL